MENCDVIAAGSRYVALGSSFGAGPGLRPRAADSPRGSGRSSINYAHLVAEQLGLSLTDATFSGATTADLLVAGRQPAQLDAVTPDTKLVTMTAGGNDIGYLGALTLGSVPAFLGRKKLAELLDPYTLDDRFARLRDSLTRIAARVHEQAPDARLVFVEYLAILPPAGVPANPPGERVADWGRLVAARLSDATREVAKAEGCDVLPVADFSHQHNAWSDDPWTRRFHLGLRGGAPYHPNAEGMRQIAKRLVAFLSA
jgi:lysophospholipase L1-like esterase